MVLKASGTDAVEAAAPAKVNLALLVGPRRADGYHEIASLMLPVTLADHVRVEHGGGRGLTVDCAVCPGEENLAARVVRELEGRLARTFDVRVSISKHVPDGAGLGGGSSDAAATLMALDRLFGLQLSPRVLHEVATAIGADVPFFLSLGPQLAMGRGQVLKQVALPEPLQVVIAVPDFSLSTAQVYGWRDEDAQPAVAEFTARAARLRAALDRVREPGDLAALVENDLESSVVARRPAVAELKQRLLAAGAYATAMSGSGPCVFGLFADEAAALAARAQLAPARTHYVTDLQARPQRPRRSARQPAPGSK